jgi:3-dehydroquinate dehydratase-2|tara:strand:- start:415 stop:825 length:411 start_codon:yes stop_codon:yes gene_type:complete
MKLLIIHGPNLNLLGIWSSKNNQNITLDKVNRHIRRYIRDKDLHTKIIQSHNESKIVSYIQNNRNKIDAIIIVPGPWQYSAYTLSELLELVEIPFITLAYKVKDHIKLLNGFENLIDDDLCKGFETAIDAVINKLK